MATLAANDAYLSFNGVDVSGYWTGNADYSASNSTNETTSGSGVDHVQREPGLNDHSMSFSVTYDTANLGTIRSALEVGTKGTLVYGPEGNTVGLPKFECSMILTAASVSQTISKEHVMWELEFEAAAEPTATIEGGDTF